MSSPEGEKMAMVTDMQMIANSNLRLFSFKSLKSATANFRPSNRIGEGGFGDVFRGALRNGTQVTIKRFYAESSKFWREINMISNIQNPNLVRLIGCCVEGNYRFFVYEYLENSLASALLGSKSTYVALDWHKRAAICLGTASGLLFLHEEHIIHRNIKASNILLDRNFCPKIGDFALAVLFPRNDTVDAHLSTEVAGTIGYIAPEYALYGHLTEKADVYSFGVVVLEIISRSRAVLREPVLIEREQEREGYLQLVEWTQKLKEEGRLLDLVDPEMTNYPRDEVLYFIKVALLCIQADRHQRPTMRQVVKMLLSKEVNLIEKVLSEPGVYRGHTSQHLDGGSSEEKSFSQKNKGKHSVQENDSMSDAVNRKNTGKQAQEHLLSEAPARLHFKRGHFRGSILHGLSKGAHKIFKCMSQQKQELNVETKLLDEEFLADTDIRKRPEIMQRQDTYKDPSFLARPPSPSSFDSIELTPPPSPPSLPSQLPSSSLELPLTMSPQRLPPEVLQRSDLEITQSQEMHAEHQPYSIMGESYMPTEMSFKAAMQNAMVFLLGGRSNLKNRTLNMLVESMKSSSIGKIGICGKAGVGKTTLMEALKDLPAIKNMFDCVICVTVPPIWNVTDLQMEIARQSSLGETDDYRIRDLVESFHLKFLLILDDVNEHINLEMIGIPEPTLENGCKIILMTRLEQLCHTMALDLMIRLEDLLSWELFCENVGNIVEASNIQPIARQVVEMCSHFTRAIILMARALKDVSDVDVWNTALERLSLQPQSQEENLEDLMVDVLKFSCERLDDDVTRKCLRRCVMLSENQVIARESLIHHWITDGLIDTRTEGNKILENLTSADLLESIAGGVFIKLQTIDHHILLNSIIQSEESRLFIMRGSLGLTEPPKLEEWENSKVIYLMHNELSELPVNPRCPILSALFLQKNYKLRKIPPSFFDYMPALQVLNLSRTRIKSLPESLFRLVNLKRLFLNNCDLLMILSPEVGELKHLEVLDLEGTVIMDLPKEVEKLTNLTCLEVSFYEDMNDRRGKQSNEVIPRGIISALANLEELNIDVSPDDKRWDACVEAIVGEVCGSTRLHSLKFYFPKVAHLGNYLWYSTFMIHPLSHFRFIVGDHAKRIISRLSRDVEFELERWDRCLRYVNGVGFPGDIRKVLKCATAFYLDRHTTVRHLSQFGIENMAQLKCCVVGECNELQVIIGRVDVQRHRTVLESLEYLYIYYMKNLTNIWEGPLPERCLSLLKSLTLQTCPRMTAIFTQGLLDYLCNLEELTVEDCPALTSVVKLDHGVGSMPSYYLPKLKRISLRYLPELTSISSGLQIAPKLEWMGFYYCPNLKFLSVEEVSSKDLKRIKGEKSWWEALEWRSERPDYLDDIFVPIDTCFD